MSKLFRFARLLCWLLVLPSVPAAAAQDCEVDGVAVNPFNGHGIAGRSGLMRCVDHDTGQLLREQELSGGKQVGLVRVYRNGKPVLEYQIDDKGRRDGRAREFSESGQVLRDETYVDGRATGIGITYYPDGRLKRVAAYGPAGLEEAFVQYGDQGLLTDIRCADRPVLGSVVDDARLCGHRGKVSVVNLYLPGGVLHAKVSYLAGKRLQMSTYWPDGKLSTETEFGPPERRERSYAESGVRIREERWARQGDTLVKESEQLFHETTGVMTSERRWLDGQLAVERTFYLNGSPRRTSTYQYEGDVQTVTVEDFYDDGTPAAQGSYVITRRQDRLPTGVHRQYDRSGRLRAEATYDNAGRLQSVHEWPDGAPPEAGTVQK
ncbi:hypothetical protein GCM10023144_15190 [Pigmentiphaga soli]|uniref:Toxin-antitoxin system YwqK family antitoxin n=1 Tax=Pigmentiphaga soli TaxID=1007095 RepID=A0ABP8GS48_9BURK